MCETICGDGYVTADEQCDDGNLIFEDGCHQCLKACTIGCSACNNGVCNDCLEGFSYFKQQCIKIDENFHDPRCNSDCLECSKLKTLLLSYIERHGCLLCKPNYENIDNRCYSICGDQIQVEPEKCDDKNLNFEDGCHQCNYNCPISCSICYQGICYWCEEEFFLYEHRCFLKIENDQLAFLTNFECSDLKILQFFSSTLVSANQIQAQTPDLDQSEYNLIGYYAKGVLSSTNFVRFTVDLQCSQNQKLEIQFNDFESGFDKESLIFLNECHNTFYHTIRVTFVLNKIKLGDEILVQEIIQNLLFDQQINYNYNKIR